MPVAAQVLRLAETHPDRPAITSPARQVSYAQLGRDLIWGADALRSRGVRPGQYVPVALADPVDALTALLAADAIGAVALVCDRSWPAAYRSAVTAVVRPAAHIDALLPRVGAAGQTSGQVARLPHPGRDNDIGWAGFTSGSTGRPRVLHRTRGSWTRSFKHVTELTGIAAGTRVMLPGSLASSLFCFAAVHGLAAGAHLLAINEWSPGAAIQLLSRVDAAHLVPATLRALLDGIDDGAPSSLRTAVVGGAALPGELRARAEAAGIQVVSYYGAAELSFVAVDEGVGLCPFPQVEIEIRPDPRCPARLGEVWVRSPWLASGYLPGTAGPLRRDADGWATVGDLAELPTRAGAPLVLRGRGSATVLTGGATVLAEDVETVIRSVPGIRDVVVVGVPHERLGAVLAAVVTGDTTGPPKRSALAATVADQLTPAQRPRRWYLADDLPRTAGGKVARAQVQAALAEGSLPARALP